MRFNANTRARRRRIVAEDELEQFDDTAVEEFDEEEFDEEAPAEEGDVDVDPDAADLLFEAEDVAELVAEITGSPVEVTADENTVTFAVGEDEYKVEAEGDEEVLEATRRPLRGKRPVKASRRPMARRPVAASRNAVRPVRPARPVAASKRPIARKPVTASRRVATRRPIKK